MTSELVSRLVSESGMAGIYSKFGVMMFDTWVRRVSKTTLTKAVVERVY